MNNYSVLIIDDHPLIIEVYQSALQRINLEDETTVFKISTANNCDAAIKTLEKKGEFNLVFLDISLPKSSDEIFLSGEDIGIKIRKLYPKTKIIICTTYNDNYRVFNILKSINPDGFLIKNEFRSNDLVEYIKSVLEGIPAYSKTALKLMRKQLEHDYYLDEIDRSILHHLSFGTKTLDLENVIPMSRGGIASRIRKLKEIFDVVNQSNSTLVLQAKEKGVI